MENVRLDKWLWAARFYKTRALAADAIDMGRVTVNDERVKRARLVREGDAITIRRPPFAQVVVVAGLSEQRGPATVAQALYRETPESAAAREKLAAQLRAAGAAAPAEAGRPSKQDRRAIDRLKGRDA
jgi:ribosome-associated heat shock protein Hsp15